MEMSAASQLRQYAEKLPSKLVVTDPSFEVGTFLARFPVIAQAVREVIKDLESRFGEGNLQAILRGDDNTHYLCIRIHSHLPDEEALDVLEERLSAYRESCIMERLGGTSIVVYGK